MQLLDSLKILSSEKGDSIILEDEVNGAITYKDFELLTGRFYNYLLSLSLPKEKIVLITVKRSYRKCIAMVGALKAGVPYVSIGDNAPKSYIDQVYEECEPILVIDDSLLDKGLTYDYLSGYKVRDMHDLAFVVYTTGSSGIYKGVMQEYGAIEKRYNIASYGRALLKETAKALENMSFFFLVGFYSTTAIEDFINLIVYKSRMIIVSVEHAKDVNYLVELAKKKNVYTISATSQTLSSFVNHPDSYFKEYNVCYEMFPCKYSPNYKIYNCYGMSESCGSLCFKEVDKDYDITPVGTPCPTIDIKILNKNNKKTNVNEIGEIAFVPEYFRGYIKRNELFINSYSNGYFHTGDMGYYNEDGDIVVIGRKIDILETDKGYIIPLFISNLIKKYFIDISNCYVKIFTDENPILIVAYYISTNEYSLEDINNKIKNELGSYSLPTHLVKLDKFEYGLCKLVRNSFVKPNK